MDLVGAIDEMERSFDEALPFALMDGAMLVAEQAKTGHTFQNRTGRLEAEIHPDSVRGSWRNGYTVTVVGARPYGSYLEEGTERIQGYAFLLPAYERVEDQVAAMASDAMADAANRTG
jgi:HK97 gp10 family phage protein